MRDILLVGLGGAAGSVLRFLLSSAWLHGHAAAQGGFPAATLAVNAAGSLLIGAAASAGVSGGAYLFAATGFCGGFTTFSAFSLETVGLLRAGHYGMAALYASASFALCLAAAGIGFYLGSKLSTFKI